MRAYPDVKIEVAVRYGSGKRINSGSGWSRKRIDILHIESDSRYSGYDLAYLPFGSGICLC